MSVEGGTCPFYGNLCDLHCWDLETTESSFCAERQGWGLLCQVFDATLEDTGRLLKDAAR